MIAKFIKVIFVLLFVPGFAVFSQSKKDTLRYKISLDYMVDLSDTYGGGEIFTGEFGISKSWYGARLGYGHYISQDVFIFKIPLEESGYILEIPFEEMAVMKMGTFSLTMIPIQGKKFTAELLFGTAYARAKWLCFKSVEYMFDIEEGEFTSLARNYQLIKDTHFGYQVGLWISFCPLKNVGLDLNLRIQDLSNGGTFFFVGGGFCFNL